VLTDTVTRWRTPRIVDHVAGKDRTEPYGGSELGDRLFRARRAREWSQGKLGQLSGLDRLHVLAIEKGKNQARTVDVRASLAKAFGVSVETMSGYLDGDLPLASVLNPKDTGSTRYEALLQQAVGVLTVADSQKASYVVAAYKELRDSLRLQRPEDLTVDHAVALIEQHIKERAAPRSGKKTPKNRVR
jgi:transcriptional regulator with XRE-family HTH domain